jgi:hypothetical protein
MDLLDRELSQADLVGDDDVEQFLDGADQEPDPEGLVSYDGRAVSVIKPRGQDFLDHDICRKHSLSSHACSTWRTTLLTFLALRVQFTDKSTALFSRYHYPYIPCRSKRPSLVDRAR